MPEPTTRKDPMPSAESLAARDETVKVDALSELEAARHDPALALGFHRRVADKLFKDGSPERAFAELARAARELFLDTPAAADLLRYARLAHLEAAAADALEDAVQREGTSPGVRRQLARLYRGLKRHDRARVHLEAVRGAVPDDRLARRSLVAAGIRVRDFEAAQRLLAEEVDEAVQRKKFRLAHRAALLRARLLEERMDELGRAAQAYQQAAEHAQASGDVHAAFSARLLAAMAFVTSRAGSRPIEAALRELALAGRAANREAEATTLAAQLGKKAGKSQAKTLAMLGEAAMARGAHQEALALMRAALEADPEDTTLASRVEGTFVARGAWAELAAFYRERAARERKPEMAAELLGRLAELLESELDDRQGAIKAYAAVVELVQDPRALAEQIRLMSDSADPAILQKLLDGAVARARATRFRAEALLLRGEVQQSRGRADAAAEDFAAALALEPANIRALAGRAETSPGADALKAFDEAFTRLSRGTRGRAALARRLARLWERDGGRPERAQKLWEEVLAEAPGDAEAEARLIELYRKEQQLAGLVRLLERKLARNPVGNDARQTRHELAARLEQLGRADEALALWRQAVRLDPADTTAWRAFADRCEARQQFLEAAEALEGAAQATTEPAARADLFSRLARLCRERLKDAARAGHAEQRARQLRIAAGAVTESFEVPDEAPEPATSESSLPPGAVPPLGLEVGTRTPSFVPAVDQSLASRKTSQVRRAHAVHKLMVQLDEEPLEPAHYRVLAEHYDRGGDAERTALMEEIANALDGDPMAEPLAPKKTIAHRDWAPLRHPDLRGPTVELLSLAGAALCAASSISLKAAGCKGAFSMASGKGAERTADALLTAVRVLGVKAPDVHLSDASSPPFFPVNTDPPRLLVGKLAATKPLPASELRFFAGRALFTLKPELFPLRALTTSDLRDKLLGLADAASEDLGRAARGKLLLRRVPAKARDRAAELAEILQKRPADLERLAAAARHTANRAGLLVAGGVAPAVKALRAKRGATDEVIELVRFAASERYLALRPRR